VPYIGLSLTYDHRAIDGGPATLFLREIKEQIEHSDIKKNERVKRRMGEKENCIRVKSRIRGKKKKLKRHKDI